ncbi:MAG TPA: 4-hydroxy-3-methylbut-2-enyl diphosphate reductase [bacterium]|nr:4-hydroxy-3-methylbut-2-enyl diphosphate reductase [bacterium]HOL47734.1 4-hydroxy-3-methylbut-2-enyl diphosphate reductase [bacterium]HPQ18032.1 4-hydroxy-3-methylbut-2-enyl diphosphate reductase [bacterium]
MSKNKNSTKIFIAPEVGFCFGVKRSIELLNKTRKEYPEANIITYGPIIHNEFVINEFIKKNIYPVNNEKEITKLPRNTIIVIRSHGVGEPTLKRLKKKGYIVIDGTCPFVKKVHLNGLNLCKEKYSVILIGDKEHPEVKGIAETLKNKLTIINSVSEVEKLNNIRLNKIGVIIQTTQDHKKVNEILLALFKKYKEIKLFNTLCNATFLRQYYANLLSQKVDLMMIIGSKTSGNTRRLFEISKKNCKKTYLISDENDIKKIKFTNIKKIGIITGASTPDLLIKITIENLKKIMKIKEIKYLKREELEATKNGL